MSRPLGYRCYVRGNRSEVFKYITSLVVCMLILSITKVVINSQVEETKCYYMEYQYVTPIEFKVWGENERLMIEKIKSFEDVDGVYPCYYSITNCNTLFMSIDEKIYFVDEAYIKLIFQRMGISYEEGKLPKQDSGKAIVSSKVSRLKGYQIGDLINGTSKSIYCEGIYESIQCIDYVPTTIPEESLVYLIVPAEGKREMVNQKLKEVVKQQGEVKDLLNSLQKTESMVGEVAENFNIIMMMITFMTSTAVGSMMYLHYRNRRSEIGLLSAMGYSQSWLIKRMTREIIISTLMALSISSILLSLFCFGFNQLVNAQNGYEFFKIDESIVSLILTVALFMMTFSCIPTWLMLSQKESVYIAERRE